VVLAGQLQFRGMGRIKGHYEWDDDDLTPGRKKEGGLHQNLFDPDGNLKGSARFVPEDEDDPEPLVVTETVYVPVEERRRNQENDELADFVAEVVARLARRGLAAAAPIVAQWVRDTAVPSVAAQRAKLRERQERRKARRMTAAIEGTVVESDSEPTGGSAGELAETAEQLRPDMSQAEAQARYLAALAARAYSEEQLRLVAAANIVDGGGLAELERSLAELPADQLRALIEAMATNPTMLAEDRLAELASILGRRALRG
jgi:hypothetical protein